MVALVKCCSCNPSPNLYTVTLCSSEGKNFAREGPVSDVVSHWRLSNSRKLIQTTIKNLINFVSWVAMVFSDSFWLRHWPNGYFLSESWVNVGFQWSNELTGASVPPKYGLFCINTYLRFSFFTALFSWLAIITCSKITAVQSQMHWMMVAVITKTSAKCRLDHFLWPLFSL